MKITLLSDTSLRVELAPAPLTIEAPSVEQSYTAFHMLASGLGLCTFSVLHSWAEHAHLGGDDLAVQVSWSFAEDPHRVSAYDVEVHWPSLPPERMNAAQRVASLCAVHATLSHSPAIDVQIHAAQEAAA